ncbi:MAG: hypothetical protein KDA45_05535 [Planctomycetales bacterium]|nr:hypothetical protein [Planctomycetales bacterium]
MNNNLLAFFTRALLLCPLCVALPTLGHAQTAPFVFDGPHMESQLVYLMQGERRQLSEDFMAELDGDTLRISLESSGLLQDTPSDQLLVSLVQPSGVREELRPDLNGEVVFRNIRQGLAAIVVTADSVASTSLSSAYAAMPFFVTAVEAGAQPREPLQLPVTEVEPQRVARALLQPAEAPLPTAATAGRGEEVLEKDAFDFVTSSRFRVQRRADGSVRGRVVVPQRGYEVLPGETRITFYREGQVVATALSSVEGNFVVRDVPLGVNGLVAVGPAGHAAYAVEIMEFKAELVNPLTESGSPSAQRLVALQAASELPAGNLVQADAADTLIVFLIPPALMDDVRTIIGERWPVSSWLNAAPPAAAPAAPAGVPFAGAPGMGLGPMPGGGFGGGGSGGGSGGGGGFAGGIGPLIAVAAIPAIIAATDDDENFDFFNPPLTTPLTPLQ